MANISCVRFTTLSATGFHAVSQHCLWRLYLVHNSILFAFLQVLYVCVFSVHPWRQAYLLYISSLLVRYYITCSPYLWVLTQQPVASLVSVTLVNVRGCLCMLVLSCACELWFRTPKRESHVDVSFTGETTAQKGVGVSCARSFSC